MSASWKVEWGEKVAVNYTGGRKGGGLVGFVGGGAMGRLGGGEDGGGGLRRGRW